MSKRESRYAAQLTFNLTLEQKATIEAMAAAEDLAVGSWVRKTIAPFLTGTPTPGPLAGSIGLGSATAASLPGAIAIAGGLVGLLLGRLASGNPTSGDSESAEDSMSSAITESALAGLLSGLGGDVSKISNMLATQGSGATDKTSE